MQDTSDSTTVMAGLWSAPILVARGPPGWNQVMDRRRGIKAALKSQKSALLDSHSQALKELGKAVRTTYLLEWIMDESLRRTVHKGTTKVERHHKFAKHLAFGAGGHLRSNNPADQEKAIVYNELVTNAVALQTVVDQTQALHVLKSKGIDIRPSDLAFLSPYATSKLKRFGEYPTDLKPEAMPTQTTLPK